MFDELVAEATGARGAVATQAWTRVESAACARRLTAMVDMLDTAHAATGSADRDQWCLDNWDAVCAHIGAAQRLTCGMASGLLLVGVALRDRLPKVAALFAAGLISYALVRTIVHRSTLVTDPDARRDLDAQLADALQDWEPLSQDKTDRAIDALIESIDPYAVRRTQTAARSRGVDVVIEDGTGLATLFGTLFAPDAVALDTRLTAFADTVCPADPRTAEQRRADALGALSHGADRLPCLCGTDTCPAATSPPSTGVVIHLVGHTDTITDPDTAPDLEDGPVGGDDDVDDGEEVGNDELDADAPDADADSAPADSCTSLDGIAPPMFTKPLRELTLAEAMAPRRPPPSNHSRPAALMGGQLVPGPVARRAALGATLIAIVHPGHAPPEPRYTPSRQLADFVRCRDMTCRFPGCSQPATTTDLDHTVAYPHGPTSASNLKCLCRKHHLLKTFWSGDGGWRDRQLPDGTVIWTAPDGGEHVTRPGSRLLFPQLCQPTAPAVTTGAPTTHATALTMPRRRTTRAHDRARRIHAERELNEAAT